MSGVAVRQACRRLAIVSLGALFLYVGFAAVASALPDVEQVEGARFWPSFLPDWPNTFLLLLAATLAVCDALLWALARSASRRERERLEAVAAGWRQRAEAKMAAAGVGLGHHATREPAGLADPATALDPARLNGRRATFWACAARRMWRAARRPGPRRGDTRGDRPTATVYNQSPDRRPRRRLGMEPVRKAPPPSQPDRPCQRPHPTLTTPALPRMTGGCCTIAIV